MDETDVIEIGRGAIWTILQIGGPVMLVALAVGLIVSLFQALTQIQEMTLAFVPKILVIFVSVLLLLPTMVATLSSFTEGLADRIVAIGG